MTNINSISNYFICQYGKCPHKSYCMNFGNSANGYNPQYADCLHGEDAESINQIFIDDMYEEWLDSRNDFY